MANKTSLFFDVDGVLLDYTKSFSEFWNQALLENRWSGIPIGSNPLTWRMGFFFRAGNKSATDLIIAPVTG